MGTTLEASPTIPPALRAPVDAALARIDAAEEAHFEVTGLLEANAAARALESGTGDPVELGLVLCDGDRCLRQQVRIVPLSGGDFDVSLVEEDAPTIPPRLDPPDGVRVGWLDAALARHAFVVLVFYRGFW